MKTENTEPELTYKDIKVSKPKPRVTFLKISRLKSYVKYQTDGKKKIGTHFMELFDAFVQKKLDQAIAMPNGTKKTLDPSVAAMVGLISTAVTPKKGNRK